MTLVTQGMIDENGNPVEVLNGQFSISYVLIFGFQLLVSHDEEDAWVSLEDFLENPEGISILEDVRRAAISKQVFHFLTEKPYSRTDVINTLDRLLNSVK